MCSFEMDSLDTSIVHYCCVCDGSKRLHTYNGGDNALESLVELCLGNAPSFHSWYFHTMGNRTYGFLVEDGKTYFTIAGSSLGNSHILQFLQHVRDGFNRAQKNGLQGELLSVIQRLVASLEDVGRLAYIEPTPERPSPSDDPLSTKAPLLGRTSSKHERKKMKDRAIDTRDVGENHLDNGVAVDIPSQSVNALSLQKSMSSTRNRGQQVARRLWCRQVRIIIAFDVLLCLILFGIWLAVCNGFQCISRG